MSTFASWATFEETISHCDVQFWWRDDDASVPDPRLTELLEFADTQKVPVCIAAIPYLLEPTVIDWILRTTYVQVAQHGLWHRNNSLSRRKSELCDEADLEVLMREAVEGQRRLRNWFRERYLPIMVPPWNNVGENVRKVLPAFGFPTLSTIRHKSIFPSKVAGLLEIPVDIGLVDWTTRRFPGEQPTICSLIAAIEMARLEQRCPTIGILTHHALSDMDTWSFIAKLLDVTRRHGCTWLNAGDISTLVLDPSRSAALGRGLPTDTTLDPGAGI